MFSMSYHSVVLIVGWIIANNIASPPTICVVVDGGGYICDLQTIISGTSVSFQLADDGRTIQFVNPYGNICFWNAIFL